MSVLEDIERLCDEVYGKGSAVSVDPVPSGGWTVRCWDKSGIERDSTGAPLGKQDALTTMRRRLQRASFLRLDPSGTEPGDG